MIHRELRLKQPLMHGTDVQLLQANVNKLVRHFHQDGYLVSVDGQYGQQTARSAARILFLLGVPQDKAKVDDGGHLTETQQTRIGDTGTRSKQAKALGKKRWTREKKRLASVPLRERALKVARTMLGVMEEGGNNMGPVVGKIIRENGGTGPEPWCGDFVAYCYRHAGSKAVQRLWASVAFLGTLAGLTTIRKPLPGDIVRFTFSHTGLFVRDNGDGTITTIEGNTGPFGAVSDGDGGDGVYEKVRSKSLVTNYRRVKR